MIEGLQSFVDAWSEPFLWALIQNTLFLGILFFILHRLQNLSAQIKYWIAIIGYIKCLLPPFLPAWFISTPEPKMVMMPMTGEQISVSSIPIEPAFTIDWLLLLFIARALSALIMLLVPVVSNFRMHMKLRDADLIESHPLKNYNVPIYQSARISIPLSVGIIKPKIYVPAMWQSWTEDCRKMILKHELAHIKRGDGWMKLIQSIVHALYFFHPLVWVLNRKVHDYREMACDDSAVQKERAVSVEYAKALVQIAEDLVHSNIGCASASALIRQRNELLNRVKYQMEGTMKTLSKKGVGLIALGLIILTGSLLWTKPAAEKKDIGKIGTGKLYGKVTDEQGQSIPEATISITTDQTNYVMKSNEQGEYYISGLEEGKYDLSVSKMGYKNIIFKDVTIQAGKSKKLDFKAEKVVIDLANVDDSPQTPPPPAGSDDDIVFVAFDTPPKPVGGFAVIQEQVVYPDLARIAGIEGRVTVYAQISEEGQVLKTKVVKSLGNNGCDESAVTAIRSVDWKPALASGKPVTVWIAVPVDFKLSSEKTIEIKIDNDENIYLAGEQIHPKEPKVLSKKLDTLIKGSASEYIVKLYIDSEAKMDAVYNVWEVLSSKNLLKVSYQKIENKSISLVLPSKESEAKLKEISQKNICKLLIDKNGQIILDNKKINKSEIAPIVKKKYEMNEKLVISVSPHPEVSKQIYLEVLDELKKADAKRIAVTSDYQITKY